MTASANRMSIYTTVSGGSESKNGDAKKDLWSSMLDSVASGKRLPEKNLLVLGMPSNPFDVFFYSYQANILHYRRWQY
jgi:dynein light intermediate chain 1, cytosolic